MNALAQLRGFWITIWDGSGPIGNSSSVPGNWAPKGTCVKGDWRHLEPAVVEQLVRAAYPGLTVLSVAWRDAREVGFLGGDALVVTIPGTHELPKPKVKVARKPVASDWDPLDNVEPLHGYRGDWLEVSRLAPAPARVAAVEAGPECRCGISHTLGSFRACALISATDRTEGFTAIHDEARACTCGAVLMHTTKRLLGDRR